MENKSLKDLYKSKKIRMIISDALSKEFEKIFKVLMKNVTQNKPYLCLPTRYSKERIRALFINKGFRLDCIEDLELILEELKVWKHEDYRLSKESYINAIKDLQDTNNGDK